jgi:hypothetical protein
VDVVAQDLAHTRVHERVAGLWAGAFAGASAVRLPGRPVDGLWMASGWAFWVLAPSTSGSALEGPAVPSVGWSKPSDENKKMVWAWRVPHEKEGHSPSRPVCRAQVS